LKVTARLDEAILSSESSFICVGAPSEADGNIDLSRVDKASRGMREASSIKVVEAFLKAGAEITVNDPKAVEKARMKFGDEITYVRRPEEAVRDADASLIVTEWPEFSEINIYNSMRGRVIVDGRRAVDPHRFLGGFEYHGIDHPRDLGSASSRPER
jgi:UDP-glucose 6-dehydrogenase